MKTSLPTTVDQHFPAEPSRLPQRWRASVLSWPAWQRVVAVLPLCLLLWLGVAWALAGNPA
ncbi:MAG: hypothetical protein ACRYGK_13305 [Janthinobacterium lividum]